MKLEVGMYVRSKINGLIGKIANIEELINEKGVLYYELEQKGSGYGFCSTEIDSVKASFDIIDLIKEGDYINGQKVYYSEEFNALYVQGFNVDGDFYIIFITQKSFIDNIETIVTKESYSSVEYRVETD